MDDSPERIEGSDKAMTTLRNEGETLKHSTEELERTQELLHRGDEEDQDFSARLRALVETTNELSMTESVNELCRQAVTLGCSRLGFDRLGIWFLTDEPGVITGTYGVDDTGAVCDEHAKRVTVNPEAPDGRVLLSKEPLVLTGEAPLVDAYGNTVGCATQAFAALWDGANVIGHVSADNRVSKTPLSKHQCELLRLYGSVIGYMCARKKIEAERTELIAELREALANIKTLHGLIPICCNCNKIRDDQGFWKRVEEYLQDHSNLDFSHGLCPACTKDLYPGLDIS